MIRINLLPVKAAQKKEKFKGQLLAAAATLLITVALCALGYLQLLSWVQEAKEDVERKKVEISRLMKTIGEVNQYKKRQEELRAKLDILDRLEKSRSGPVLLLDELYKAMPDKVWLEGYKESGGKVNISGVSINEETVALFMRNLETSSQFDKVTLKVIQQIAKDGVKFHKFDLDCTLENQMQVDLQATGGKDAKGKTKAAPQGT
jgi:type IV pilus assembly protein PilN